MNELLVECKKVTWSNEPKIITVLVSITFEAYFREMKDSYLIKMSKNNKT